MDSDEALWNQALGGDADAFGAVFDRHHRRVFRHCLRSVPSKESAEDITAMVFLEAWRKRTAVRLVNGSVLAWLLAVANNTIRNQRRSLRRYQRMLAKIPPPVQEPDPADSVGDRLLGGEVERLVRASFAHLGKRDQDVLLLCVVEELTMEEASAVLKVPVGTVKSRLHRAKSKLAAMLSLESPEHLDMVRSSW